MGKLFVTVFADFYAVPLFKDKCNLTKPALR
jgi:hypothetical protein